MKRIYTRQTLNNFGQRIAPREMFRLFSPRYFEFDRSAPTPAKPGDAAARARTCCFSGHRDLGGIDRARIGEALDETLYDLIDRGVRVFKAGGALGFDTLAALHVLEMRERFPDIRLILELPCRDQYRGWPHEDILLYKKILGSCDEARYVSDFYFQGCMHIRNRRLVDGSGYCVVFLRQNRGGTAATYNYAKLSGAEIINLAECDF